MKKVVLVAVLAVVFMVLSCGSGEECSQNGQLQGRMSAGTFSSDGCPEGCYPSDDDWCCCPD